MLACIDGSAADSIADTRADAATDSLHQAWTAVATLEKSAQSTGITSYALQGTGRLQRLTTLAYHNGFANNHTRGTTHDTH